MGSERTSGSAEAVSELVRRDVLLAETLASINDAVATVDCGGVVRYLNRVAQDLTRWALDDAIGLPVDTIFRVIDGDTGAMVPDPVRQVLETTSPRNLPDEAILIARDGTQIPINGAITPLTDSAGAPQGAVLAFRDVTEIRQAEREARYRAELDRLAARISTAFAVAPIPRIDEEIAAALEDIGQFCRADRCYVFLFNKGRTTASCVYEWAASDVMPLGRIGVTVAQAPQFVHRILERESVRISSPEAPEEVFGRGSVWTERGIRNLAAVPMLLRDSVIGFVGVDSGRELKPWSEDVTDLLYLVGNVLASALERREDFQKLESAREREVSIGAKIQERLLLSEPPAAFGDLLISAVTIPSSKIDGDFYDFLLHLNGSLDVIFGDVMGKGIPAALLAAGGKTEFLRSLSHLLAISPPETLPEPQVIVNSVHSLITPQLSNLDTFITLSYARFDPHRDMVTLVDCGNTRLIRCTPADGSVQFLSGANLPLGFSPSEIYSQAEYGYKPGDIFVFYSDGATEARNPEGEMFGLQRLVDTIVANRHLLPGSLVKVLQRTVTDFAGTTTLKDDFTCVAIRAGSEEAAGMQVVGDEMSTTSGLGHLASIRAFLRAFCESHGGLGLSLSQRHLLELAVTEVASNITRHSYRGQEDQPIWVRIEAGPGTIKVRLSHCGMPYEGPGKTPSLPMNGSQEGGFGLYIVSRIADDVFYGMDDEGRYYIELVKRLPT